MDKNIAYLELLGVTLSGVHRPDQGLYWTDLTGWWGLPDLRGDTDNIPGAHGRFRRSTLVRDARVITLVGHILGKTNAELMAVRERLESALSQAAGTMVVHTNTYGTWERYVEIDTLNIEPDHGRAYTKFTVDMVAPDPRRYGALRTVGPATLPTQTGGVRLPQRMPWNFGTVVEGSVLDITNSGHIDLSPSFRVSGGSDVTTITELTTGRRLTLEWPIDEGAVATFDSVSRKVLIDGQDATRWLTSRQWFSIPAGETHRFQLEIIGADGSPEMYGDFKIGAW